MLTIKNYHVHLCNCKTTHRGQNFSVLSSSYTFNHSFHQQEQKKLKLTVRAEVIYQDYFLNQSWRTSHQDTERKKGRYGGHKTQVSVTVPV